MAATIELLCEVGYADLSMAAIAKRSGVARSTLYRRWATTSEVVCGLIDRISPDTVELLGDTRVDLEHVLQSATAQSSPLPVDAQIALMTAQAVDPAIAASLESSSRVHRQAVNDVLEKAISNGELRRDLDIEVFTDLLGGFIVLRRLTHQPLTATAVAEAVRTLLEGAKPWRQR